MKLIVGLGNPGKEYEQTRHNVGFLCVDRLAEKISAPVFTMSKKFEALTAEVTVKDARPRLGLGGEKIILAKPQTFMNSSGKSVAALYNFYRCAPDDLYVVYDDIDLPFGQLRFREKGSAGSHNGMKSIIASLGFENFPRLRIGIESRGEHAKQNQDLADFVLQRFSAPQKKELPGILDRAAETLQTTISKGTGK